MSSASSDSSAFDSASTAVTKVDDTDEEANVCANNALVSSVTLRTYSDSFM